MMVEPIFMIRIETDVLDATIKVRPDVKATEMMAEAIIPALRMFGYSEDLIDELIAGVFE